MGTAAAPATKLKVISIDRNSRVPYYQQLADALRAAIEQGKFAADETLPTIADLMTSLGVSKNTVRRALHKLAVDGALIGDAVTGYRIPGAQPEGPAQPDTPVKVATPAKVDSPATVENKVQAPSTAGQSSKALVVEAKATLIPVKRPEAKVLTFNRISTLEQIDFARLRTQGPPRPFRPGIPDTHEFPLEIWETIRLRLLRERKAELLDFCGTFGYLPLRESIAARLRNARGLRCSPEQVIVCAGAQHALNLVINTLVSPGDPVGMEEPGHYGVKAAFIQAGAKVLPLLVDDEGLSVPDARRQNPPLLVYTTPPAQFPLGGALTLPRRQSLLEFAKQTNTWIIEDDSDGDFSYTGRPFPSLQGSDDQNRVIYLGTTGKTLFPSLEIGYIVVPLSLMENFSKAKEIMGGQPSVIDQATLANFLGEGHFDRHLHRMNVVYYQRMQALSESVDSELNGYIDLEPAQGGLHAVGWLARGLEERAVAASAASAGIELPPLSNYGKTALTRPGVVFGFASFSEKRIKQTVHKLGQALRSPQNYSTTLQISAPVQPATKRFTLFRKLFGR